MRQERESYYPHHSSFHHMDLLFKFLFFLFGPFFFIYNYIFLGSNSRQIESNLLIKNKIEKQEP